MPPPIPLVSPAVSPLNSKERAAVALSHRWANRNEMPHAGEDGYVRFLFGATLPTVVCAPLQVCNLALQPGEVVNNVNVGDSVRWKITPSVSGSAGTQTTHLIIKPTDAGLTSSLDIETNRRTYAVKLVSTDSSWMPLVAFNYPDEAQAQWQAYQQTVAFGAAATTLPTGQNVANLEFLCISGTGPSWSPTRAYTDGAKTYIEFPSSISFQAAPALVALANDGSWFSRPSSQIVNYRVLGNRYVVDAALDRAALISGVGSDQQRVVISRGRDCR
jgi:type IV secretion system protein VirB9